ncbi:caspase domain-containing protein [Mycena rebaudengoi]|nr:caspase domain-containing protein [Mycena rebaudengoi]KAJ7237986.1 caspase domain-containing protein [Mycena rebaudengoi]
MDESRRSTRVATIAEESETPADSTSCAPNTKKALLIGVGSELSEDYPALRGAHKDVLAMKDLLIEYYEYHPDNIDVLMDDGIADHRQPTCLNILAAITALVKDTKPKDEIFFHYSGHSTQIPNLDGSEEDGMDECLLLLDGEMIVDDELKATLVAPLPVDSRLITVLDTCHSGSLLDLKHSKCNRVFIPWKYRGRRCSEAVRNVMVRQGALPDYGVRSTTRKVVQTSRTSATHVRSQSSLINVVCELAPSQSPWATRKTLPTRISGGSAGLTPAVLRTTVSRLRATSLRCGIRSLSDTEIQEDLEADADIASSNRNKPWLFAEATRCESPVSDFPCDGWCREPGHVHADDDVKADVVSLAASKDSQFSWEDEKGISMTTALIEILKADPHPSFKDLLTRISYAVYDFTAARHYRAKENKTKRKRYEDDLKEKMTRLKKAGSTVSLSESGASSTIWAPSVAVRHATFPHLSKKASLLSVVGRSAFHATWQSWNDARKAKGGNMDDVQTPQLASPQPLNMERRWMSYH